MESIIQKDKECFVCKTRNNLHLHHCLYGSANRKKSTKYGLTVYLCAYHHNMSNEGVHFNKDLDLQIKQTAQKAFEETIGTRQFFREEFGKSWI